MNDGASGAILKKEELPEGWRWAAIEEIAESINPGFPSGQHNQNNQGIPHIRPMNISRKGDIDLSVVKYIESCNYQPLKKGDVIFNNTNSPVLVGKTAYIHHDTDWAYSNHMTRIRLKNDLAFSGWVAIALHYLFLSGYFAANCRHHVNQASISSGFLAKNVFIPLPPRLEQETIVSKVEELSSMLDAAEVSISRVQTGLQRYKASVLKAACEGRLVSQEPGDEPAEALLRRLGKAPLEGEGLPVGWCWAKVEDIASVQLGRQRSPKNHQGEHMRLYIRAANITWKGLDLSDVMSMNFSPKEFPIYRLEKGDILLSEASGSRSEVGKPAIWNEEIPDCCFQNTVIRVKTKSPVPEYLYIHFRKDALSERLGNIAKGVGIHHLGAERLSSLEVALPPLKEQTRIATEVEHRLSVIDAVEATIKAGLARAGRLRQAVLKAAFEGRLV